MTERAITLEINQPVGTYKVDGHAGVLFPKAPKDYVAVETVRAEVNRAARIAVARARHEGDDLRKAREHAKRLMTLLDKIESNAADEFPEFQDGDIATAAADLAVGFVTPDPTFSIAQPLVHIIEDIASLRSWAVELRKRASIAPPPPSRSGPLARYFIDAMADAHRAWREVQPPSGRTGPFVDLLEAAWLDLGFPKPVDKEGDDLALKVWLGMRVEERAKALRGLTIKNSDQTR
jgi:hypothetical protein